MTLEEKDKFKDDPDIIFSYIYYMDRELMNLMSLLVKVKNNLAKSFIMIL